MYAKNEAILLTKEFWTRLGQYMKPVPSSEGEKINWINYKTAIKYCDLILQADHQHALLAFELSHPDLEKQNHFVQHLQQMQPLIYQTMPEWKWQIQVLVDNRRVSRVYIELRNCNILKKENWPTIISFFKNNLLAFDAFWSSARYNFQGLL